MYRLLLNCIIFFHLAPQLTQWSNFESYLDKINLDRGSLHKDDQRILYLTHRTSFQSSINQCKLIHSSCPSLSIDSSFSINLFKFENDWTSINEQRKSIIEERLSSEERTNHRFDLTTLQSTSQHWSSIYSILGILLSSLIELNKKFSQKWFINSIPIGAQAIASDTRGYRKLYFDFLNSQSLIRESYN